MTRFQNILYLASPAEESGAGLERAVTVAERHQARLTVMLVLEELPGAIAAVPVGPLHNLQSALQDSSHDALERLVVTARARVSISTKVVFGRPFLAAIREVLCSGCDLLVKTSEARGGRLFGSTDRHLLRKCPCPVWLVKAGDAPVSRRVLAAVDFHPADVAESAINRQILELAASVAVAGFAELHVVHAWEAVVEDVLRVWSDDASADHIAAYAEGERRRHEEGLARLMAGLSLWVGAEADAYLAPRRHLVRGPAAEVVPALARRMAADLIVMGTVARTGVPGLLIGNTAETILERIDSSVLAVKPPGFVSPVPGDRC